MTSSISAAPQDNLLCGEEFNFHNLEGKNASMALLRLQLFPNALHHSFLVSQQKSFGGTIWRSTVMFTPPFIREGSIA